jgi:hypothetical protein
MANAFGRLSLPPLGMAQLPGLASLPANIVIIPFKGIQHKKMPAPAFPAV